MENASRRRIAAFRLDAAEGVPVVYLAAAGGIQGYSAAAIADEALAMPRWLVRQAGRVEGVAGVLNECCDECRERVLQVAASQLDMWASTAI